MSDDAETLLAESRRTERLSLRDLDFDGPPVRLRDLCDITGFSKMKFLDDIERGDLNVKRVRTGRTHLVLIERDEARRYLDFIGFAA